MTDQQENNNSTLSFIQRLRQRVEEQGSPGEGVQPAPPKVETRMCPNCGAGRAKDDGLTACAFCGYKFMEVTLSNGIHIKEEDNSL